MFLHFKRCIAGVVIALFIVLSAHADVFDVRSFGAVGDKSTKNTQAFQKAIDACNKAGGGTVLVPAGDFISGQLTLKSNVTLAFETGATLWASRDTLDYRRMMSGGDCQTYFLLADKCENIAITGRGTIHGTGEKSLRRHANDDLNDRPDFRIGMMNITNSRNVALKDITIKYSDTWTLIFHKCDGVFVDGVSILNNYYRINSDGIDPSSSKNVFISNCYLITGDDGICLKTIKGVPCENVVVDNCTIESVSTAIKLGTSSDGDFRDIHFSNCTVRNSGCGIGFFIKDGGTAERITFSNISIGTQEDLDALNNALKTTIIPIYIDIEKRRETSPIGAVRDITFSDIQVDTDRSILLQGMPESKITNITLKNITMRIDRASSYDARVKRGGGISNPNDERISKYIRMPSYCAIAYAEDITIDGFRVYVPGEVQKEYDRTAISVFETTGVRMSAVDRVAGGAVSQEPVALLHNCQNAMVYGNMARKGTKSFLGLSGKETKSVVLKANDLTGAASPVTMSPEVPKGAVAE